MKLNRALVSVKHTSQCSRHKLMAMAPFIACLTIVLSAGGCGVATDTQVNNGAANINEVSIDVATANALYHNVRTPESFYQEDFTGDAFTAVSHIKNTDQLPIDERDGLAVYEISSNDFNEAMVEDERAAEYRSFYNQLVGNSETSLYYQFTRVNPDYPEFFHLSRVFKASVLDRTGVDRTDEDSVYIGRIALNDIEASDVKLVIEYLWMFTLSNNYRHAVIESYTTETDDEFIHVMQQAELNFSYGESCDTVNLYEIRYTVPKDSGLIWRDKVLLRQFFARFVNDQIEICQ